MLLTKNLKGALNPIKSILHKEISAKNHLQSIGVLEEVSGKKRDKIYL